MHIRVPVLSGEVYCLAIPGQDCSAVAYIGNYNLVLPHQHHSGSGAAGLLFFVLPAIIYSNITYSAVAMLSNVSTALFTQTMQMQWRIILKCLFYS